jgi:uncharacterized protein involved in exopolysaccharide biosynthesis
MYPRDLPALTTATPLSLQPPFLSHFAQPGLSLAQIGAILWAYRKQSLMIIAAVMLAAGVACVLWPRTYEATATLMVDFEVNDPLAGREFPSGLVGSYMATQVELARSPEVLLPVIDRLQLTGDRKYAAGYDGEAAGLRLWVAARVRKKLLVEQGKYGSQLVYVTYRASDAAEAAQVANAVAEVYAEQQRARLAGPAGERAQRYTAQLAELKAKVAHAQQQVTAFRQQSGLIDSKEQGDVGMLMLSTLETRLLEAQNARRVAEARASTDPSVGGQVLSSPMIQTLKTQLALQAGSLAQLRTTLGARHPQMIELQSQMRATRDALAAELRAYSGNAAAELAAARQLERDLEKAVTAQRSAVIDVRQVQDSAAKHQLELESAQSVYKHALEGYDQVMFASTGGYTNIGLVSRATPPPKASKPRVGVIMILSTAAAIVLGIGLPLGYGLINRRVRCRDDIERDHGVPVLIELGPIGTAATLPALTRA